MAKNKKNRKVTAKRKPLEQIGESTQDMLERFRLDITNDADAVDVQSDQSEDDMRFLNVIGGMWDGFFEKKLQNKVKMQFPMIAKFLRDVIAEWNMNRVSVNYKPGDDDRTSDKDAKILNGLWRADFRNRSTGKKAVDNAVLEVMHGGYGAVLIAERFEDKGDPENDLQRIELRSLFNAYNSVYWQDGAQEIDKSDATRCTVLKRYNRKSFLKEFPGEDPVSAYQPHNRALDNNIVTQEEAVFVATRYEIVEAKETVFVYDNFAIGEIETFNEKQNEEMAEDIRARGLTLRRKREVVADQVMKSVFSGVKFFEEPRRISGKFIPVVPFYGERMYVSGVEWWKGFVRDLKDISRLLNQLLSKLSENSASSSDRKPIFDPDQVQGEGFDEIWSNIANKAYALANVLRDKEGNPIAGGGPIGYIEPGQLDQSTAALMTAIPALIQSFTGINPVEVKNPDASGKAIKEARKIQNLTTQPVMENISTAIERLGVVYESKASELYTTKRFMTIIGEDGSESTIQLMKVEQDPQTGRFIETNNISGKKFKAYSKVGPQYETQRQETTDVALRMMETFANIPAMQQFMQELGGVVIENMSGTGLESIKKLNRRMRLLQGTVEPETDEEKQFLIDQRQQQEGNDTQKRLAEAVTQQQLSEARNLDAASAEKIKGAELKAAQTRKTLADIEINQAKTASDIRINEAKTLQEIRESIFRPLNKIPIASRNSQPGRSPER